MSINEKDILRAEVEILNKKYKGNGITIHPWGVVVEQTPKQRKKVNND
jgi:hypothetical protein